MTQAHIDYMLSKIPAAVSSRSRGRRAGRLLRIGRVLVLDRRGVRHFRRTGDLLTRPCAEQRHQRLTGIALMCGASVLPCLDAMAKYLRSAHATLQVVGGATPAHSCSPSRSPIR